MTCLDSNSNQQCSILYDVAGPSEIHFVAFKMDDLNILSPRFLLVLKSMMLWQKFLFDNSSDSQFTHCIWFSWNNSKHSSIFSWRISPPKCKLWRLELSLCKVIFITQERIRIFEIIILIGHIFKPVFYRIIKVCINETIS